MKPFNRNCDEDPDYPPLVMERGNKAPENMPDLNLEGQKKYEAMIERNARYALRKTLEKKSAMDLQMITKNNLYGESPFKTDMPGLSRSLDFRTTLYIKMILDSGSILLEINGS